MITVLEHDPPLIGRREEIGFLKDCLLKAMDGHGSTVFISGPAGIGKTKLCETFQEIAIREGCESRVGRCLPGTPVPFLPFTEALRDHGKPSGMYIKSNIGGDTNIGMGSNSIQLSVGNQGQCEMDLFHILGQIEALSKDKVELIRLEDLHWGDSASIQAIHFLARSISNLKVLILVTYREEDLVCDKEGAPNPLRESLRSMRREGLLEELRLTPLDQDDLRFVIEGLLDDKIDGDLADYVLNESEGNPLFAIELVRSLVEYGDIVLENGIWLGTSKGKEHIPGTIREIILRRTERLSSDQRAVLESAAILGGDIDGSIITEMVARSKSWTLEILDVLDREHHLLKVVDGRYRFNHEMIQKVTGDGISLLRRKELHRIAAKIIEARGPESDKHASLAKHYCWAEDWEKCIHYSFLFGEMCWRGCVYPEAVPSLTKVLELTQGKEQYYEIRSKALEYLGDSWYQQGNYQEATRRFEECLSASSGTLRPRILRKMADCWLMGNLGTDMRTSTELIDEAESSPEIDQVERGEIYHFKARAARWVGDLPESERLYELAIDQFSGLDLRLRRALEVQEYAYLKTYQEQYNEALEMLEVVLDTYNESPYPTGELVARWFLGAVYFVKGRYEDAINQFMRAVNIASKIGDHQSLDWCYYYLSLIYEQMGNTVVSMSYVNASIEEGMKEKGQGHYLSPTFLAHLLLQYGRVDEAYSVVNQFYETIEPKFRSINTPLRGMVKIVWGEILARKGMAEESDRAFSEGLLLFQGTLEGSNYIAMAFSWYGKTLLDQGRRAEAIVSHHKSMMWFQKNGNDKGIEREALTVNRLLASTSPLLER